MSSAGKERINFLMGLGIGLVSGFGTIYAIRKLEKRPKPSLNPDYTPHTSDHKLKSRQKGDKGFAN